MFKIKNRFFILFSLYLKLQIIVKTHNSNRNKGVLEVSKIIYKIKNK